MDAPKVPKPEHCPKALRKDYAPSAFYYGELSDSGETRLVAWTSDPSQLKALVYQLLEGFSDEMEFLFKLVKLENDKISKQWEKYRGVTTRDKLVNAMRNHENCIFQDGFVQFCAKQLNADHYLVVDEFGVFFAYPNSDLAKKVCEELGFEHRVEELISEKPLWRRRPKDADEQARSFLRQFDVESY